MKSICSDKVNYELLLAHALYIPAPGSSRTAPLAQNTPGIFGLNLTHLSRSSSSANLMKKPSLTTLA